MDIKNQVNKIWMLSKLFECQIHPCDGNDEGEGWPVPVAANYGGDHTFHRAGQSDWVLVHVVATPQQIKAARKDPRVVVLGKHYSKPPKELLEAYAHALDPEESYQFLGQVLEKIAEEEPLAGQE